MAAVMRWVVGAAAVVVALSLGCSEGLVPASYEGEPLYAHPNFTIQSIAPVTAERPRWAVFWLLDGFEQARFEQARFEDGVEQPGTSRPLRLSVGPLHLFSAPPTDLLATADSGARYGIARLLAYDDTNGDRRKDADEPFIGADRRGGSTRPTT